MTSEKAMWDRQSTKVFIKVCVVELREGNRPSAHLSKVGWKNLITNFNLATGRAYNKKQLKNRWDTLKKEYNVWKRLLRSETGLEWDGERGTVDMPPDWWTQKIKESPDVAKFRERGLILLNDQQLLFDDTIATGENAWTPSPGVLPTHMLDTDNDEDYEEFSAPRSSLGFNSHASTPSSAENIDAEHLVSKRKNSLPSVVQKKPKKTNTAQAIFVGITNMAETCKHIRADLRAAKDNARNTGISITDCLTVLYKMPEIVDIEESDETFTFALHLFDNKSYREIFTGLWSDTACLAWIKAKMGRVSTRKL